MNLKLIRKRTQVIRSNLSSMDDVQNTQQTQKYFSTVIQKNQSLKSKNSFYGGLYSAKKR